MTINGKELKSLTPDQPLPKGEYSIGDFVFTISKEHLLGKGGCGEVYRGTSTSKEKFQAAIKIIRLKK